MQQEKHNHRLVTFSLLIVLCRMSNVLCDSSEVHIHYDPGPVCDRLDIPGYPTYYMEMIDFYWVTLPCPTGAVYQPTLCGCIYVPTVPPPTILTVPPTKPPTYPTTTSPTTTTTTTTTTPPTTTTTTPVPTTTTATTTSTTTITTTTRKRIIYKSGVLSLKAAKKQCSGCQFEGGVGYKQHDTDCNMYIMCSPGVQHGDFKADVRRCSVGHYWDQSWLTCRPSKDVICETDPCKWKMNGLSYSHGENCRAYWTCRDGISVGHCCPRGEGYVDGFGCVRSASCNNICGEEKAMDKICDKYPVPGNPQKFQQSVPGHGLVDMSCAAGTMYDYTSCKCQTDTNTQRVSECKKDLDISFTSGLVDTSGKHVHVSGVNLTFVEDSACFDGTSAIVIPRFANAEMGNTLNIRLQFKFVSSIGDALTAILYNGDCGMQSSIVIAANKNHVVFKLTNKENVTRSLDVHVPIKPNQWITGKYTLHNNKMSMTVDGRGESKLFYGNIARSRCGLKLGWGKDYESFVGCVNQMSLSFCPDNKT